MRVALVCCPSWSIVVPPYNISLLKSIVKQAGHEVKAFDFNADAHEFLKDHDIDFWEGQNFFYWEGPKFDTYMLPMLNDEMNNWVDSLLDYNPDFIGFTVYHTSIRCITHMINRIRNCNKTVKISMGGPHCFTENEANQFLEMANYVCTGEGEEAILNMLECPENRKLKQSKFININDNPVPDYEDYDLNKYLVREATSLEASRGCIAKCTFCFETHYWTYKSKTGEAIVNELQEYKDKYGMSWFRFNDSLVNGNLKEFRKMIDLLIERDLKIKWNGYARIDGRMDYEFMKKMKKSGNTYLSYGIESGSQKVLNDMNKRITVEEAEQNLKDGYRAGISANVNWVVGFPTEEAIDQAKSLVFIFNNRKYINNIASGMTCGLGSESDITLNKSKYGIEAQFYWDNFMSCNFRNSIIHRAIRLICTHITIDLCGIDNGQPHVLLPNHYTLERVNDEPIIDRIDVDECPDFTHLDNGSFESSFYAEYLSFFWVLYKIYGPYKMTLTFDEERDRNEFGPTIAKEYNAVATFNVNDVGQWVLDLEHNLKRHFDFDETVKLEGVF